MGSPRMGSGPFQLHSPLDPYCPGSRLTRALHPALQTCPPPTPRPTCCLRSVPSTSAERSCQAVCHRHPHTWDTGPLHARLRRFFPDSSRIPRVDNALGIGHRGAWSGDPWGKPSTSQEALGTVVLRQSEASSAARNATDWTDGSVLPKSPDGQERHEVISWKVWGDRGAEKGSQEESPSSPSVKGPHP